MKIAINWLLKTFKKKKKQTDLSWDYITFSQADDLKVDVVEIITATEQLNLYDNGANVIRQLRLNNMA